MSPSPSLIAREEEVEGRWNELYNQLKTKADFTDKEKAAAFNDLYDAVHDLLKQELDKKETDELLVLEQLCKATHGPSFFEVWNYCNQPFFNESC